MPSLWVTINVGTTDPRPPWWGWLMLLILVLAAAGVVIAR